MTLRQTHTSAELRVSAGAYDEIRQLLEEAGYWHAFQEGGAIDMHGIGLTRGKERDEPEIRWGEDPEVTCDMLLIAGVGYHGVEQELSDDELLAIVRAWTREQREEAERWAGAVHRHAGDHDGIDVPPEPAHVTAIRAPARPGAR